MQQELKQIAPLLSDIDLLRLYNKSISIHQCRVQGNGNFLENDILSSMLSYYRYRNWRKY